MIEYIIKFSDMLHREYEQFTDYPKNLLQVFQKI